MINMQISTPDGMTFEANVPTGIMVGQIVDAFLEQWSVKVHTRLEWVQRASSAVENINSIFKPVVNRKKHFDHADSLYNFVALFVLWHNMRVFKEGKRKGYSPFEILGIDLGEKDWRTLLGYPLLQ